VSPFCQYPLHFPHSYSLLTLVFFFFLPLLLSPLYLLFPYTTLFRSLLLLILVYNPLTLILILCLLFHKLRHYINYFFPFYFLSLLLCIEGLFPLLFNICYLFFHINKINKLPR